VKNVARAIVPDFHEFGGEHCETASLKKVLDYHELHLSEEMLLGLGGGIGFIYWYMKSMPAPFVGGRSGGRESFCVAIARRLDIPAAEFATASPRKAHDRLVRLLSSGEPAICYGDMAYLPYFAVPEIAHFGGHVFVVFGVDEERDEVSISDRGDAPVIVSVSDLQKARGSKFQPFPPRHVMIELDCPSALCDLSQAVEQAIRECCNNMLEPPISNFGLRGIRKWADIVPSWQKQFSGMNLYGCLFNTYMYIEIGGTGGSSFRTMYAKFLDEASQITGMAALKAAAELYRESAAVWSEVAIASLPDSVPALGRIRKLIIEKDDLFEHPRPGTLDRMRAIGRETDELAAEAADLPEAVMADLLAGLRDKVAHLYDAEARALDALAHAIGLS
jgi:hypothetical protein